MRNVMRSLVALSLLLILCVPTVSFAASNNTVTYSAVTYSYYEDGSAPEYNKHAIFTSSIGSPVYCGNHVLPTPVGNDLGDSKVLEMHEYTDETVRKILYYGYLGPKEWKGFSETKYNGMYKAGSADDKRVWCGNAVTGIALTKTQDKGYVYDVAGLDAFWDYIQKAPDTPKGFKAYIMYGKTNEQNLFTWIYNAEGQLSIKKISENYSNIVKDCPAFYSLKGAEYLVSTDVKGTKEVGRLVTKSDGTSNTLTLKTGTYYIQEKVAPKGFKKDNITHVVVVREGETNVFDVMDEPLVNTIDILLMKKDSKTKEGIGGAIFEVNYYADLTDELDNKAADRTWQFETDSDGIIALKDSYKVGGDPLYKDENGNAVGLIGTYKITEVKPPEGYARDTKTYIEQVTINRITGNSTMYRYPEIKNTKQTITIELQKYDTESQEGAENKHDMSGAVYEVRNEDGTLVGTIETDIDGKGQISKLNPGKYFLKEIKAPLGFVINSKEIIVDAKAKDDNSKTFEYKVEAGDKPTTVEIFKYELVGNVELPISGAKLQIISSAGEVVDEFISSEDKYVIKYLPIGTYTLKEVSAPDGYELSKEIVFEVMDDMEIIQVKIENKKIEVPVPPEEPEVPETPEVPEIPEVPEEPEIPETPEEPEIPETPDTPNIPKEPKPPMTHEPPKTGDLNDMHFWYKILLVISFAAAISRAGSSKSS